MIAYYTNKLEGIDYSTYDLKFSDEDGNFFDISLASVIFELPYDNLTLEDRALTIGQNLYPTETLTQVIIE
jgi:hypothetical protein